MRKKALIAMSGGVDSSVAAYLMKQQGYDCIGVTMKLFYNEDIGLDADAVTACCSLNDVEDARSVCAALDIPHYVFNFTDEFKGNVINRFVDTYRNGATPNPCIDCNRYIKFGKLFARARELDADYVVTGHYARIEYDAENERYLLKKARDESKDQSYVLYCLTQEQLGTVLLPLGELTKTQIRHLAAKQGFRSADKPDSQDICFVPDGDYAGFIERYTDTASPPGDFVDIQGNVLGQHRGLIRYTVGQRKGLGLSVLNPMYVRSKDVCTNTITLCENEDLFTNSLDAVDFNWIIKPQTSRFTARTRYKAVDTEALATPTSPDTVHIEFDKPQRAITKGQAVVLYDGDIVIGGGTIA